MAYPAAATAARLAVPEEIQVCEDSARTQTSQPLPATVVEVWCLYCCLQQTANSNTCNSGDLLAECLVLID